MKTLLIFTATFSLLSWNARAITRTWDGEGAADNFNDAANWNPNGVPANGDDLVFPAAAPNTVTNDLNGRTFASLSFPAGTTLAGNAFTLTGGISTTAGVGPRSAVTIEPNVTLGANQTFTCGGAGGLSFEGSVIFGARTLTVTGARNCTFHGVTGSSTAGSRLIKTGTGLLRVSATAIALTNQPWDVSAGTLDVDGILQATVILTGGKLTGEGTINGALDATGGEIEPDDGDLQIAGNAMLGGTSRCLFHLTGPSTENGLDCTGTSVIIQGNATVVVDTVGYTPVWDEDFQLLSKSTTGAITGEFFNLDDNGEVPLGTTVGRAHYNGGNGNDLTLDIFSTTRTWDGGHTINDNWDEPDNWTLNTRPHFGDVLVFPNGIQSSDRGMDNNFPNDTVFRQLIVNGVDYTLRGNPIRLTDGIILEFPQDVSGQFNLDTSITLTRNQTFQFRETVSGGVVTGKPTLHLDLLDSINLGGHVLIFSGSGTMDGRLTGSGGIIVPEDSRVTLDDANDYTGTTVIAGSVLSFRPDVLGTTGSPTRLSGSFSTNTVFDAVIDEPFILEDGAILSSDGTDGFVAGEGSTTEFRGSFTLDGPGTMTLNSGDHNGTTDGVHEIHGTMSGNGDLVLKGDWTITGAGNNTATGTLTVDRGDITLAKTAAGPQALAFQNISTVFGSLVLEAGEQISNTAHVTLGGGLLDLGETTGRQETIGALTMTGGRVRGAAGSQLIVQTNITGPGGVNPAIIDAPLRIVGVPCVLDQADGSATDDFIVNAAVTRTGSARFERRGAGRATFNSSVSARCDLHAGLTLFNGTSSTDNLIRLEGGTLGGTGRTGDILSQAAGGTVSPGAVDSAGLLTCGTVQWNANTRFRLEIGIATLANGFDRISVNGSLTLSDAVLELVAVPNFGVPMGFQLPILLNDTNSDDVAGTFDDLPEGAVFNFNGLFFQITYGGGDGNDVVLTRVPPPAAPPTLNSVSFSAGTGPGGQDQMTVTGTASPSQPLTLEVSTNLSAWTFLRAVTASPAGTFSVTIDQSPSIPRRFFRLRP